MGIFDKLLNKKETLPPAPVSRVRPVSPGNGRKTREELRLECEILTKEAIHEASLYLAEKIIEQEARDMIDKSGQGITMHYSAAQAITEKEKADLVKEEDIENSLSHEVYSSRNLLEILKTIMTERGEKSAKELGKVIINYKELGGIVFDLYSLF